tara:strand:- start:53 stop:1081 length:1029 start_codon:yes stop_codon:yes gene_type:complete
MEQNEDLYDRAGLLTNWADNIIIPAYDSFYNSLIELNGKVNNFTQEPSTLLLTELSDAWLNAYKDWQHVEMFDIGLAEVINYKGKMNIYPTDSELIEQNIIDGDYDLSNNNNFDSRGFPAMDYMIHGLSDDPHIIVNYYLSNPAYTTYLVSIIDQMINDTDLIVQDWDSFRLDFINSTENTATSAMNKMTNDFIYYFEKGLRANKIGIPAGIFSNEPIPSAVEAFYKEDVSKQLAVEALLATKNFFKGKYFDSEMFGASLESYLSYLDVSSLNNLSESILLQFTDAETQLDQLSDSFIHQIETNNMEMLLAYDAIQQLVVYFKVDMLQALSISVDYVDADGD